MNSSILQRGYTTSTVTMESQHNSINNVGNENNDNDINKNKSHMGDIDNNTTNKWVVNISSMPLTDAQRTLLARGPNFTVVPTHLLKENI